LNRLERGILRRSVYDHILNQEDSISASRRRSGTDQKAAILKRYLADMVPVSDLCDECGIKPTQTYTWQKMLFDKADAAFHPLFVRVFFGVLLPSRGSLTPREGRDEEALRCRNQVREQLRAEGKTRGQAMEGAWEATRLAFPPLLACENVATAPNAVPTAGRAAEAQTPSVDAGEDAETVAGEDWVIDWLSPLSAIAEWQAKHGVILTEGALKELLERLFGFGFAWAWLLGAKSGHPPSASSLTDDRSARVAALIERAFEKIAEAVTVENLATFLQPECQVGEALAVVRPRIQSGATGDGPSSAIEFGGKDRDISLFGHRCN
jgi:hypothetical protein